LEEASGRIWEASARRAGMVASLEGWVRRVVKRVVRVAVRVWVAGGMVRGGFVLIRWWGWWDLTEEVEED
jgi:hypothetical protein